MQGPKGETGDDGVLPPGVTINSLRGDEGQS